MFDHALLYLKHRLVDTPLETPMRYARYRVDRLRLRKVPELLPLIEEDRLIDAIIDRTVRADDHCWDVGAHLGSMSAMLQRRVGPRGRIETVEPDPQKSAWLKRKLRRVHTCALADQPGQTTFFINTAKRGFSGLRVHGNPAAVRELVVELETLDRLHPADAPLRFIKIDVEGAELSALRGGRETIRRCRPTIVFECTRSGMDAFGYGSDDMFGFFADELGYDIYRLEDHLRNLDAGSDAAHRPPMTRQAFAEAHVYPWGAYNFVGRARDTEIDAPGVTPDLSETETRADAAA